MTMISTALKEHTNTITQELHNAQKQIASLNDRITDLTDVKHALIDADKNLRKELKELEKDNKELFASVLRLSREKHELQNMLTLTNEHLKEIKKHL